MMSHGFLRSNKTEVCLSASLVPAAGSFPSSHCQLTEPGEVFLPLTLVCASREQGGSPQKAGSPIIKTLHNLYILTNKASASTA